MWGSIEIKETNGDEMLALMSLMKPQFSKINKTVFPVDRRNIYPI